MSTVELMKFVIDGVCCCDYPVLAIRRPQGFTCDEVCEDVLLLDALATRRRAKRFQSGALSLNSPKLSFKLDGLGNPVAFQTYPIRDSNRLIEVT